MKSQAYVNVYLILFKNDQILLALRQNTGYEDNKWALVAGAQETNESATQALIREVQEEIGITLHTKNLSVVHVMHRHSGDRENIDIFVQCTSWEGLIENKEPHKCGGIQFFNLNELPTNTVEYIKTAINHIAHKRFYSEIGWNQEFNVPIEKNSI